MNIAIALTMSVLTSHSSVDGVPWITYVDAESDSVCEVVNSANLEWVVSVETGGLVNITGTDLAFLDLLVDGDGFVFFLGDPAGQIRFAEDGDGARTLWWLTPLDYVADVSLLTGELVSTGLRPIDFINVPCEACSQGDGPDTCTDTDGDGVLDVLDDCFNTPLDELAGDDGCSCSQIDADADGVSHCEDLCPNTPIDELPDILGCSCSQEAEDDFDGVEGCSDFCPNTPFDELPDILGCSCSQVDDDLDGVDNCDDLCPDTPFDFIVEPDGCVCDDVDFDFDGVGACFDLCPGTPFDVITDITGCSCEQLDDDQDGVDNCDDLCTESPLGAFVGPDGCILGGLGGINLSLCGTINAMIFPMILCGLVGLRRTRRV